MSRFYIYSKDGDGGVLAYRLKQEGFDVVWNVLNPWFHKNLDGIVERVSRRPRMSDIVVFDSVGMSEIAEELRDGGCCVIGGSEYGDRLENDRSFAMREFQDVGLKIPQTVACSSLDEARDVVTRGSARRWVFKPDDEEAGCTYVARDEIDMINMLQHFQSMLGNNVRSIMQQFVEGTCISTEGWFDGSEWIEGSFNSTIEQKDFLVGGIGPKTGCEWCCVWSIGEESKQVKDILSKFTPKLSEANYVGPFDLNCVVAEGEAYVLEATPRFGYDAIEAFASLWQQSLGSLLEDVTGGKMTFLGVAEDEIGLSSRLAIPPYPFAKAEGPKASGDIAIRYRFEDSANLWLAGVRFDRRSRSLLSAPSDGTIGVNARSGKDLTSTAEALKEANRRMSIADLMWRDDVGSSLHQAWFDLIEQGFSGPASLPSLPG